MTSGSARTGTKPLWPVATTWSSEVDTTDEDHVVAVPRSEPATPARYGRRSPRQTEQRNDERYPYRNNRAHAGNARQRAVGLLGVCGSRHAVAELVDEDAGVLGVVDRSDHEVDATSLERRLQDRDEVLGGLHPGSAWAP